MNLQNYTPVILAGGLGTRLSQVVTDRPKVLAPVAGRPFLAFLLAQLRAIGFSRVILCTGYKSDLLESAFGSKYQGLDIVYSREEEPLGTGGALRLALPLCDTEHLLVMNGDSYVDVDLGRFLDWYYQGGYQAALLLLNRTDADRYGSVTRDGAGRVIRFKEKNPGAGPGLINGGIYLMQAALPRSIPPGTLFSLEYDFFPGLLGQGLYGYECQGRFIDIGTPESYSRADDFFSGRLETGNDEKG